jgi:UDP-N-acetylmuramate--alanine ligase
MVIASDFFDDKKHLHFIGVGGSGLFPIIQIMLGRGFTISGSDNNEGDTLDLERAMGVTVYMGHDAANVSGADVVIYSAAIMQDNPELVAAREAGIPTFLRADILGWLTRQYGSCICVAGTHGKTSTTGMATQILMETGNDPTAVIGGKLPLIGGSGRSGSSDIMTVEADEYVDTFLRLSPDIAVILNIDEDHLEYFKTLENIQRSFRQFADAATKVVIANGDDPHTRKALAGLEKRLVTFGRGQQNDFRPVNENPLHPIGTQFDLYRGEENLCTIALRVVGEHNILNAVAACAAALEVGVEPARLPAALAGFRGTGRRFEILGKVQGFTVADDYAHHPTELAVTLKAAMALGYRKVWAVFQPFTYSRTAILLDDFAKALAIPDHVVMSEIMGGREHNTYNIYTADLAAKIPGAVWFPSFEEIAAYILAHAGEGDLVITMGCGDVYKCAKKILAGING